MASIQPTTAAHYYPVLYPSDLKPLVTLPPVVDVGLEIDRGRLQVGMPQLSLEVVERNAEVEGQDRMEMPQRVRGDHVEGPAVLIAAVSPLDARFHRSLVDDLANPRRCYGGGDTLAGEDVIGVVEGLHPPLQLGYQGSRDHDVPVLPRLRFVGLEPDEPCIEVQVRLLQAGQFRDPEAGARQELDDEPVPALD